ncbi:hypothetical protein H6G04_05760 [Calothrix membranacea FACHB-236]|nr:hypothetical protein [Calothrix membranacea FACHB-236]
MINFAALVTDYKLRIGVVCDRVHYSGVTREWLYLYDRVEKRYPMTQVRIQRLAEKLPGCKPS